MKSTEYDLVLEKLEQTEPKERIKELNKIIRNEKEFSEVMMRAKFELGYAYYELGELEQAIHVLEQVAINYQSYKYHQEIITVFALLGSISMDKQEYDLARYYFLVGLEIAKRRKENHRLTLSYSNVGITYAIEERFDEALKYFNQGSLFLDYVNPHQKAILHANMCLCYIRMHQYEQALVLFNNLETKDDAFNTSARNLYIGCGVEIFFYLKNEEKFKYYQDLFKKNIDYLDIVETIRAYEVLLSFSIDNNDIDNYKDICNKFDEYLKENSNDYISGLIYTKQKIKYAKKINDKDLLVESYEQRERFFEQYKEEMTKKKAKEASQTLKIQLLKNKNKKNREENKKLKMINEYDALTGVKNRRALNQVMKQKPDANTVVMILDVDHFKTINDTFGHKEGDVVLRRLGMIMNAYTKTNIQFYRFGGDEFIGIFNDLNINDVKNIINEFHHHTSYIAYGNETKTVSTTIGVCLKTFETIGDMVNYADNLLYEGKDKKGVIIF